MSDDFTINIQQSPFSFFEEDNLNLILIFHWDDYQIVGLSLIRPTHSSNNHNLVPKP